MDKNKINLTFRLLKKLKYEISYFNSNVIESLERYEFNMADYIEIAKKGIFSVSIDNVGIGERWLDKSYEKILKTGGKNKEFLDIINLYRFHNNEERYKEVFQKMEENILKNGGTLKEYIEILNHLMNIQDKEHFRNLLISEIEKIISRDGDVEDYINLTTYFANTRQEEKFIETDSMTEKRIIKSGTFYDCIKYADKMMDLGMNGFKGYFEKYSFGIWEAKGKIEEPVKIEECLIVSKAMSSMDKESEESEKYIEIAKSILKKSEDIAKYLIFLEHYRTLGKDDYPKYLGIAEQLIYKKGNYEDYIELSYYYAFHDKNKSVKIIEDLKEKVLDSGDLEDYITLAGGYYKLLNLGRNDTNIFIEFESDTEEHLIDILEKISEFEDINILSSNKYYRIYLKHRKDSDNDKSKRFLEKAIESNDCGIYMAKAIDDYIELILSEEKEDKFSIISNLITKAKGILINIGDDDEEIKIILNSINRKASIIEGLKKFEDEIKLEEEKLKEKKEKVINEINEYQTNTFSKLLKRRVDLEYALSKSAINELGLDEPEFYDELSGRIKKEEGKEVYIFCNSLKLSFWKGLKTMAKGLFISSHKKSQLNYVLPTIRASYLGEWKEFLVDSGRKINGKDKDGGKIEDNEISQGYIDGIEKTSKEMRDMIEKFDDILKNDQIRTLKEKIFNRLIFFLFTETVIVFFLVYKLSSNPNMESVLKILIPATIAQITTMVWQIVKNLYPEGENKNGDKEIKEYITPNTLKEIK